jgi:hypothetical protein
MSVNIEGFQRYNIASKVRFLICFILIPEFGEGTFYFRRQYISLPSANVMMQKESESTGNGSEHFLKFHIFLSRLATEKETRND